MNMGRFFNFFNSMKIRNKIFISFFAILLVVMYLIYVSLSNIVKTYDSALYDKTAQAINKTSSYMEGELLNISQLSYNLISDKQFQYFLLTANEEKVTLKKQFYVHEIMNKIYSFTSNNKNIISTHYIDNNLNHYKKGSGLKTLEDDELAFILETAKKANGSGVFIKSLYDEESLFQARLIRSTPELELEEMGVIFFRIDLKSVMETSIENSGSNNEAFAISFNGEKIFSTNKELTKNIYDTDKKYEIIKLNNQKFFTSFYQSEDSDFLYINMVSYNEIFNSVIAMKQLFVIVFIVATLILVFISFKLSNLITNPIVSLTKRMEEIELHSIKADAKVLKLPFKTDEISILSKTFEMTLEKINSLISEDYKNQILLKETQYLALQAQINPHFLYNTLQSINWLAKSKNQNEISLLVESLGNLLRQSIDTKKVKVTLKDELSIINDYINIQKIRFEDRLLYEVEIADDFLLLELPKMSIQPLIENSINHTFDHYKEFCLINVTIQEDENFYKIIVTDNGPGIDEHILEKLSSNQLLPKGTGIGLTNIDKRLKIMFGNESGLFFSSNENGSNVIIRIPKTII